MSNQKRIIWQVLTQFNLFAIDNIGFETFPPLENALRKYTVDNASVLLSSKIRTWKQFPLLVYENQGSRSAFIGENVWKWRQSHLDTQSFAKFDVFG
jgi:hypothetical protein